MQRRIKKMKKEIKLLFIFNVPKIFKWFTCPYVLHVKAQIKIKSSPHKKGDQQF